MLLGKEKASDEPAALEALLHFEDLAPKGFKIVPEHVETRSLFNPEKKGIEMVYIVFYRFLCHTCLKVTKRKTLK